MKIRTKLFILVAGSMISFGLAGGVYFAILAPVEQIQKESDVFSALERSMARLRSEAAFLMSELLSTQIPAFKKSWTDYDQARANLESIRLLPTVNEKLNQAFFASINLKDQALEAMGGVDSVLNDITSSFDELGVEANQRVPISFITPEDFYAIDSDKADMLRSQGAGLLRALNNMNNVMTLLLSTLGAQDSIVVAEIAHIKARSTMIAGAVVVFIILTMMGLSVFVARSVSRSIHRIDETILMLGSGDLTGRVALATKDEMGLLGQSLDSFLDALNRSIVSIQRASQRNTWLRGELIASVAETTSSTYEIESNSASIRNQMRNLDAMILESAGKIQQIVATLGAFHKKLAEQDEHIEQSVAAITQMMASIGNIGRIVEDDRRVADLLVKEADEGRRVLDDSFSKVADIEESVNSIRQMADLIAGIASQTNILSMNAAIEAAHAGEYGKGFAVVADEISKLAAASAESSDEIARTIQIVTEKIMQASSTKDKSVTSLDTITTRIQDVSRSIGEIYANISEMQAGSQQILKAMSQLKENSGNVTRESHGIEADSRKVEETFEQVSQISSEVVSNIDEISVGLGEISRNVHLVSEKADQIGCVGATLDEAVRGFRAATRENDAHPADEKCATDESIGS